MSMTASWILCAASLHHGYAFLKLSCSTYFSAVRGYKVCSRVRCVGLPFRAAKDSFIVVLLIFEGTTQQGSSRRRRRG